MISSLSVSNLSVISVTGRDMCKKETRDGLRPIFLQPPPRQGASAASPPDPAPGRHLRWDKMCRIFYTHVETILHVPGIPISKGV